MLPTGFKKSKHKKENAFGILLLLCSFPFLWSLPWSKFYTEYEPQGKKMHIFLWDYLCYMMDFRLNRKAIYHEDRMKMMDEEEIVFEKTDL